MDKEELVNMSLLTLIVAGCLTCILAFGLLMLFAEIRSSRREIQQNFIKNIPVGEKTIIRIRRTVRSKRKALFQVTYEYSSSKIEEPKKYTTLIKARSGDEAERIFKRTGTYKTMKKDYDSIPPDSLFNVISQKSDKVSYIGVKLVGEIDENVD